MGGGNCIGLNYSYVVTYSFQRELQNPVGHAFQRYRRAHKHHVRHVYKNNSNYRVGEAR